MRKIISILFIMFYVFAVPAFGASPKAKHITAETDNFAGLLSAADDTVQKALDTIDDLTVVSTESDPVYSAWDKDYGDLINTPAALSDFSDDIGVSSDWDEFSDLPTALITNGDTTHIPTCDGVYDFCETTQDYLKTSENNDTADDVSLTDVQTACTSDFHNIGGTDATDDTVSGVELDAVLFSGNGLLKRTAENTFDTITDGSSNWDLAYGHISSNGTDHTYINQDVTTTSSPAFSGLDLSGNIVLDDNTGDSPSIRFLNEQNDTATLSLEANSGPGTGNLIIAAPNNIRILPSGGSLGNIEAYGVYGGNPTLKSSTDTLAIADKVSTTGQITSPNLVSSIAIGTQPYACTSTTLNTNLNADLWDGYQFADYLDQAVKSSSSPTFSAVNFGPSISVTATGGNLVLTDTNAGSMTLTQLKSMRNIWISAGSQSEGNLTLSDATNWAAQYTFISSIKVITSSTDWDMWLCETSAFNTALITSRHIVANRNGNYDISLAREYNSDGNNVYLIYTDNAGADTADILIIGEARRH